MDNNDFNVEFEVQDVPVEASDQTPFTDPEDDRENWPTVFIEMEENKPNYEFVAAHGTKKDGTPFGHELQIMRGVDVKVPPSVVNALRGSIATYYVQRTDPVTMKKVMTKQERSSVPWRLISGGKYV